MKIISTAPTRISLFGGGTDINPYSSLYGGVAFNMAINIRQKVELDTKSTKHNWIKGDSLDFINSFLEPYKVGDCGLNHSFDGCMESGLGSSASLAVALIGAVNKSKGTKMSKDDVAEKAWDIEVNKLGLYGGKQDQYCATYGGINLMEFNDSVKVTQLSPTFVDFLTPYLIMFYTGTNRKSGKIQEGFKRLTRKQKDTLDQVKDICITGVQAISNKDIQEVSAALNTAWELKKESNIGVSNEKIDKLYNKAINGGAYAGKVMGAGGGGHMLFICEPDRQKKLITDMKMLGCRYVDFSLDFNGLETRIL